MSIPVFTPWFDEMETDFVKKCLSSGWVAQGPMVAEFEKMVAEFENVEHAIAVTSCTTALHLSLIAMGLQQNHDVLIPSFTFVATANAVEYIGATPILVDVRQDTFNIDTVFLENFISSNYSKQGDVWVNNSTKNELFGIIPVGLFGMCADMPKIQQIASEYGLKVLVDDACTLGSHINNTKQSNFGYPVCLSFHARKSITTGEGGMILTNDSDLATKLKKLRTHGASISAESRHSNRGFNMPDFDELGYNYRMTDIQAAVGIAQMHKINEIIDMKRAIAKRYDTILPDVLPNLKTPVISEGHFHTYQSYVCFLDFKSLGFDSIEEGNIFRNDMMAILEDNGVGTRQGTHAIHLLGYYRNKYGYDSYSLTNAYACDKLSISIPLYAKLSITEQDYVIQKLIDAVKKCI